MKNTKFTLVEFGKFTNIDSMLDIDWPKVQQKIGEDQVKWLWALPKEQCQMMLEFDKKGNKYLVAEFYDERTAHKYALMWS